MTHEELSNFLLLDPEINEYDREKLFDSINANHKRMFELGVSYDFGKGDFPKDMSLAISYYTIATNAGNLDAAFNLAINYENGVDGMLQKNQLKAIELYTKAANGGHVNAMFNLAMCYEDSKNDIPKAIELYTKAANLGDADSQCCLARYFINDFYNKDVSKAIELYTKAAESDNSTAQFELAQLYYGGYGAEKNIEKAIELCTKSAELGNQNAQNCLAYCYENGIGVDINMEKACKLYMKTNNVQSLYTFAQRYEIGNMVKKDIKKAKELYATTLKLGNSFAQFDLDRINFSANNNKRKLSDLEKK